jgi:hypothetical protein
MSSELVLGGSAVMVGYLALVSTVALVASAHPDEKRRADARKVLDRLLRLMRNRP